MIADSFVHKHFNYKLLPKTSISIIPFIIKRKILIRIMMTVSCSTATVERGFSALNRIKTAQRTQIFQAALTNHLMVSVNTPNVADFYGSIIDEPIHTWMNASKCTQHVHRHKIHTQTKLHQVATGTVALHNSAKVSKNQALFVFFWF